MIGKRGQTLDAVQYLSEHRSEQKQRDSLQSDYQCGKIQREERKDSSDAGTQTGRQMYKIRQERQT